MKDMKALLIDQYRETGKFSFLDLAKVLECELNYREACGAEVSLPTEIIEMAHEAASIAGGDSPKPNGRPPKPQIERRRDRFVAVDVILQAEARAESKFASVVKKIEELLNINQITAAVDVLLKAEARSEYKFASVVKEIEKRLNINQISAIEIYSDAKKWLSECPWYKKPPGVI